MARKDWVKIYEKTHRPSFVGYRELDLSASPIVLKPGQVKGIYIHSTRRGDEAIVYDNKEKQRTHDDSFITILPGRAHVSEKVFGAIPIWGWYVVHFCSRTLPCICSPFGINNRGSAWRDNREFVGQINYGAVYKLWNPSANMSFGENFRSTARCLLMCQRRKESPFATLPDECVYYILNMCRWDWVNDTSSEMRRMQRQTKRLERQRMEQEADQFLDNAVARDPGADNGNNLSEVEADHDSDYMDESSVDSNGDFSESDDESAVSDEYAWGDHVHARDSQTFHLPESDDSDSDDPDELRHQFRMQHRGSLVHRQFFTRSHIFNMLNGGAPQDRVV